MDLPGLQALRDNEQTRLMLLGVLVGALGGLAAGVFDQALVLVGEVMLGTPEPSVGHIAWWRRLFGPAVAGLGAGALVWWGTVRRRPQGIPEVIEGVVLEGGHVSLREGSASAGASVLAVAGGMSGGREGPIVQLASAVVSNVLRRLGVAPERRRVLVAAGAAAGIGASFNTPVGAAFFALEILLGNFALPSFAPVVAATVTGTVVGQMMLGDRIALELPAFTLPHPAAMLIYPVLGIVCGLSAVAFKRLLMWSPSQWERLPIPPALRPAVAGVAVGVTSALGLNEVMGNGYPAMELLVSGGEFGVLFLLLLLVFKILATAATSSSGSGAGIFAPTLFIGAVTGTLFGTLAHGLMPTVAGVPGMYGMVGMGAVAAALLEAPITITLMLFEMTRNYQVILPLLLTIAVASLVSRALAPGSIYVNQLQGRGVNVDRAREELVMYELHVEDVMRVGSHMTIAPDAPFSKLAERFLGTRWDELYVVDGVGRFIGFIDIQDIKRLLAEPREGVVVADLANPEVPVVRPRQPLADTLSLFFRSGLEALPVVDDERKLLGVLTERDVVGAYNREILRKDALLARIESGRPGDRHTDFFVLPDGHVMDVVMVGGRLAGRTLPELRLQARHHLTVVAVDVLNDDNVWDRVPADAEVRLKPGDRLVVVGPEDEVRSAQAQADADPPRGRWPTDPGTE